MDRNMWLLGFAFAAGWVVSTAMAAHLPRLLEAAGASATEAVAAAALVGPAQVAARVVEATFLAKYHPLISARLNGHASAGRRHIAGGRRMAGNAIHPPARRWEWHPDDRTRHGTVGSLRPGNYG
jgi:hypothetical protein